MLSGLIGALIGALIGGIFTYMTTRNTLLDSLDSKSGWRKELFNVASKNEITLDDVFRIKAALRLEKHSAQDMKAYSFKFMTNVIFNICLDLIKRYDFEDTDERNKKKEIKKNDREIVRVCARYLLKYHWDYLTAPSLFKTVLRDSYRKRYGQFAKETCEQIKQLGGNIVYES